MTKNRIGSLFFLIFSATYFYYSFDIRIMQVGYIEVMTARTFPYYLGVLGISVSILMLILSFVKFDVDDIFDFEKFKTFDFKKGLYFVLAMLFYGYTIRTLGFIIATIIFLIIGFKILEERNLKIIIFTSFGVSIVFWLLLTQVLGVYMAQGMIFDQLIGVQK